MRAIFFRWLLGRLLRRTPGRLAAMELQVLLCATAKAFERPGKIIFHLNAGKALEAYAAFTLGCMRAGAGRVNAKRIYRAAFDLGRRIRRITGFKESEDLERLVFYLYRNIGIAMDGQLPGEITVSACYFSSIYTPKQCALMSLMDWGVIAGICGGGKLTFTERLTQGCGRCTACLRR